MLIRMDLRDSPFAYLSRDLHQSLVNDTVLGKLRKVCQTCLTSNRLLSITKDAAENASKAAS